MFTANPELGMSVTVNYNGFVDWWKFDTCNG